MKGKIGERKCDKNKKKDRMTKKRQNIGKSKCHKDKVIKRQSNRKDRMTKKNKVTGEQKDI
jgi:hypothetical protein